MAQGCAGEVRVIENVLYCAVSLCVLTLTICSAGGLAQLVITPARQLVFGGVGKAIGTILLGSFMVVFMIASYTTLCGL